MTPDEQAEAQAAYESYTASATALQRQLAEAQRLLLEAGYLLGAKDEELLKANLKVEELREVATDFAAKIQFIVDWADGHGLLEEHLFTFPDGDTWEAGKP